MNKKVISFSLWGTDLKYCIGAIRNCEIAKKVYPNWELYFYVDLLVPPMVIHQLRNLGAKIIQKNEIGGWRGQQWKLEILDSLGENDCAIFRDADSRLNYREKACVDKWIESGKKFMNMRDHTWHQASQILGGMWGAKGGSIPNITQKINSYKNRDKYENDYHFLQEIVLPYMQKDVILFDEVLSNYPFPKERSYDDYSFFVGESFDENDKPNEQHRKILEEFLRKDNSNTLYVLHHLGLGDCLDCNAMVRILLNNYDKICAFSKEKHSNTMRYMYRDEKRISIISIPKNISEEKEKEYVNYILKSENVKNYLEVGFNNYPWGKELELQKGCAELFYDQVGIPFQKRFDEWFFKRDIKEEERLSKKLNPNNEEFIFVHDDKNRGFVVDEKKVLDNHEKTIRIVRNDMSENLFHFCKILEEAKEIHCMESSFKSLIEVLDVKGKCYFHNFRLGASSYLGKTRQNWIEIKY